MTEDKHPLSDQELDTLFDAARSDTTKTPANLMAAVLSDAAEVSSLRKPKQLAGNAHSLDLGWFASLLNGIGGWQGAAAVAASGVFGLWVGYTDIASLPFVGDLGLQVDLMLNGSADLKAITTFEDFTLDG